MPESKKLFHERRSHPLIFLAAVSVVGIMIYPFIVPLILSVITAYVFNPIVKRFEVHTRSYHIAIGVMVIIIGLPIIFAISYLSANATLFFQDIAGFGDKLKEVISAVSNAIAGIGFGTYAGYFLSAQDITSKIIGFTISLASDFVKRAQN